MLEEILPSQEYCPGAFSVNARGEKKLIGAAQRAVHGSWLLSSIVVVERPEPLQAVLEVVYRALEGRDCRSVPQRQPASGRRDRLRAEASADECLKPYDRPDPRDRNGDRAFVRG